MQGRNVMYIVLLIVMSSLILWEAPNHVWAESSGVSVSKGQTVYVPVYSNVFTGPRRLPFQLATTLSIRNTDLSASIRVTSIDYYDTKGKMVRRYLGRPLEVRPLASAFIHIEEKDVTGGFGANFIVRWNAGKVVNNPIIECVMIGATSGQGISFVSPGQEIRE